MSDFSYIVSTYNVPAEIGRLVTVNGKSGIITGTNNAMIMVNFDGDKPHLSFACHPTWEVVYGEMGEVRKLTRSQLRYQEYLRSECGGTFAEWLGVDPYSKRCKEVQLKLESWSL